MVLLRSFHIFTVLIFALCIAPFSAFAASAVPESDPLASQVPATCDADFWEVVKDRAWMSAQREITQNANYITRPDSVLSVSCFGDFMDHLVWHSEDNFPTNPNESEGSAGGFFTDFMVVLPDDTISSGDPLMTQGRVLFGALEILVLDQLMNNVSVIGAASDAASLLPCLGKEYYIEDNFPNNLLGGRAVSEGSAPTWSNISAALNDGWNNGSQYSGCQKMNDLWNRTKCYDFATESSLDIHPLGSKDEHDAFYTLTDYVATAAAGDDYRTRAGACGPPTSNGMQPMNPTDIACMVSIHGATYVPPLFVSNPTWATASTGAFPEPGDPGAADVYESMVDLISGSCAPPVKLGYIVQRGGSQYVDSVCPTPGCRFNPPSSISGTGSCTN